MTKRDRTGGSSARDTIPELGQPGQTTGSAPLRFVMRFPKVVSADTLLSRGATVLLGGVALLVVVDDRRRPLGVVLPADVLAAVLRVEAQGLESLTVLDAARSGGRFIPETSTLSAAHSALLEGNREFLVVVAEDGTLAGLITALDVLEAIDGPPPPASATRHTIPLRGLR
jgi:CBS domain-containing protein